MPGICPAVALTAFVQKNDAHLALLTGFQVHVSKPVDPHDLTSVIASLVGRTPRRRSACRIARTQLGS